VHQRSYKTSSQAFHAFANPYGRMRSAMPVVRFRSTFPYEWLTATPCRRFGLRSCVARATSVR
jgi:hypothetical protein